jgi:hypothetical protein
MMIMFGMVVCSIYSCYLHCVSYSNDYLEKVEEEVKAGRTLFGVQYYTCVEKKVGGPSVPHCHCTKQFHTK